MSGARRVVIVGAGTAGIPAALAALELGARVVLVEKGSRVGGQLWASGAITSGAGSALQRARGIDDSPEAHEEDVWRLGRGRADRALLQLATRAAGPTIDWLVAIGTRFTADSPVTFGLDDQHELYSAPRSYILEAPDELGIWRGPMLAERLTAALAPWTASPRLDLRLATTVVALTVDGRGAVVGCRLRGPDGDEATAADAVILATGGYSASQELLRRFHGSFDRLITQGLGHATGDGIHLAEAVGGVVVNDDVVIPMMGAIEDPQRPGFRLGDAMLTLGRPPAVAGDIWVSLRGERFFAEDVTSPDARERAILGQPGAAMLAIFDEPMRRGLDPAVEAWTRDRLGDPPDPRLVTSAATLAELAEAAGLPVGSLEQTVATYNEGVHAGLDALGRQAMPKAIDTLPYHAVRTASAVIVTFAGIRVNERLEVIGNDGTPIEGLYAAGELIGSAQVQGDGFSSGMSVTPAIAFGRLAARFALDHLDAAS